MVQISVIIPAYNSEKSISTTVHSVLEQNFSDFEIIIIDDGSVDNTGKVIKKLSENDSRIKIFSQENQGPFAARNLGISKAEGDYIVFIDSDDFIDNNFLKEISYYINNYNCDLFVHKWKLLKNGSVQDSESIFKHLQKFDKTNINVLRKKVLTDSRLNSLALKVVKRKVIDLDELNKINMHKLINGEDLVVSLQLFSNSETIMYLEKSWYNYVQNSKSTTHSYSENYYFSVRKIDEILRQYSSKWNLNTIEIEKNLDRRFLLNIIKLIPDNRMIKNVSDESLNIYFNNIRYDKKFIEIYNKNISLSIKYKILLFLMYHKKYRLLIALKTLKRG